MVLKKPAAPAKKAAASKKAAPVKKAVRRSAKPEPEEVEEDEDEAEEETTEESSIAEGTQDLVVRVHKSMTYSCEGGLLDNATAYADVTITADMDLDEANAEMNRARALVALALGAQFTTTDETVLVGQFKPAAKPKEKESYSSGSKSSGASGGARKASAVKKASKSRGGNRSTKSAHYDEDETEALWTDFSENAKDYWDNLDPDENDYPSIKPKAVDKINDRLDMDKEAGYLYLSSAPDWVKEHYGYEED